MNFVLFCFALILSVPSSAAESTAEEWELRRDRDGITVYTRSVPGSDFKEVRSEMTVPSPVNEMVGLVMDTDACPDWAALCKESHVAESVSPQEAFIYTYNDLPWPVTDRDAVGHVKWSVADDRTVTMQVEIVLGKVPTKRRVIRLSQGTTSWAFTPTASGNTKIISYAHLDPGGSVPPWITNMLLVDAPFDTMENMRAVVATGKYKNASFDFITNDATTTE
ncbi:MAG: hypothetical protein ACI9ON_001648 [Limisphaerales bacterium]|jgi:hypothetical protein